MICANSAHLNTDENGAPQITGGLKLWLVDAPDGKLTPELIARQAWGFGSEHRAQPLVVSISQTTECGTCYTVEEIRAIADYAHSLGMKLHMDGARIANAAAYLDTDLRSISSDAGVDLLSFGGTKNGLLFGECLVALSPDAVAGMAHLRKINLQLASKMRFISAQFIALLEHDLWLENARHSNRMAVKLAEGLQQIEGVQLLHPVQSNAVFALPRAWPIKRVRNSLFMIGIKRHRAADVQLSTHSRRMWMFVGYYPKPVHERGHLTAP